MVRSLGVGARPLRAGLSVAVAAFVIGVSSPAQAHEGGHEHPAVEHASDKANGFDNGKAEWKSETNGSDSKDWGNEHSDNSSGNDHGKKDWGQD